MKTTSTRMIMGLAVGDPCCVTVVDIGDGSDIASHLLRMLLLLLLLVLLLRMVLSY